MFICILGIMKVTIDYSIRMVNLKTDPFPGLLFTVILI